MDQNQNRFSTLNVYSRARAIEDGELIDVTAVAASEGFTVPVAFTRSVYHKAVVEAAKWMSKVEPVSEETQLGGVLDMIHFYVVQAPPADRLTVSFEVASEIPREKVTFEVVCGRGDDGSPCVTITLASGVSAASTGWCTRCVRARGVRDFADETTAVENTYLWIDLTEG